MNTRRVRAKRLAQRRSSTPVSLLPCSRRRWARAALASCTHRWSCTALLRSVIVDVRSLVSVRLFCLLRIDFQDLSRETAETTTRERGHQTSSAPLPTAHVRHCGRSLHHIRRRHGERGVVVHGRPWRRAMRPIAAKARSLRLFQGAIRWRCTESCQNPASLTARTGCASVRSTSLDRLSTMSTS